MTTSTELSPCSPNRVPLRVRFDAAMSDEGLDGTWWPQSRELGVEVADLVDNFPDRSVHITRLLFAGSDWDDRGTDRHPTQVPAARGVVNVGVIARGGNNRVVLMLSSGERLRLRVVPI